MAEASAPRSMQTSSTGAGDISPAGDPPHARPFGIRYVALCHPTGATVGADMSLSTSGGRAYCTPYSPPSLAPCVTVSPTGQHA
jgi:hypothetical protein